MIVALWGFATPDAAGAALRHVPGAVTAVAAVAVAWAEHDLPRPQHAPLGDDRCDDLLWGWVLGELFHLPLLQAALGEPGTTTASGSGLAEVGLDDAFVNRARDVLVPGTSVLLAVLDGGPAQVAEAGDLLADRGAPAPVTAVPDATQAQRLRGLLEP